MAVITVFGQLVGFVNSRPVAFQSSVMPPALAPAHAIRVYQMYECANMENYPLEHRFELYCVT